MSKNHWSVVSCLVTALFCTAADAGAQHQRLFAKTLSEIIEFDTNIQSLGTIVRRMPLPPHSADPRVVAIAGGRYLAWVVISPQRGIALFDIASSGTSFVPVANASAIAAADTMRLRLIVEGVDNNTGRRSLIIVEGPQISIRTIDYASFSLFYPIGYASGPGLIVASLANLRGLVVFDAATATHVSDIELPFFPSSVVSDESAQRVVVQGYSTQLPVSLQFAVIDATSGRLIASRQIPRTTFVVDFVSTPVIDQERRHVITANTEGLLALSLDSLDIIGRTTNRVSILNASHRVGLTRSTSFFTVVRPVDRYLPSTRRRFIASTSDARISPMLVYLRSMRPLVRCSRGPRWITR